MKVEVTIEVDSEGRSPLFPGYALKQVTRKGVTFHQWYMIGPREVSLATKHAEGRG